MARGSGPTAKPTEPSMERPTERPTAALWAQSMVALRWLIVESVTLRETYGNYFEQNEAMRQTLWFGQ
jgi:hypothetical protein